MMGRRGRLHSICLLSLAFLAAGEGRAFGAEPPGPDVQARLELKIGGVNHFTPSVINAGRQLNNSRPKVKRVFELVFCVA